MNISASVCWASTGFQLPDSAPTSASDHRLKSSRRSGGDAEQLGDDDDWERERQLGAEVAGAGGGGGPEVVDELRTDLAEVRLGPGTGPRGERSGPAPAQPGWGRRVRGEGHPTPPT